MEKATRERLTGAVILVAVLSIAVPELLSGPGHDAAPAVERAAEAGPPLATYDLRIEGSEGEGPGRQQELVAAPAARTEEIAQAVPPPVTESTRGEAEAQQEAQRIVSTEQPAATAPASPAPRTTPSQSQPPVTRGAQGAASSLPPAGAAGATRANSPSPATTAATPAAQRGTAGAGQWWVQLGSFSSAPNAENLARELRGKGFEIEVARVRAGGRDLMRVRAGPVANRDAAAALRQRLEAQGKTGASLVGP